MASSVRVSLSEMMKYLDKLEDGPDNKLMTSIGEDMTTSVKQRIKKGQFAGISPHTRFLRRQKSSLPLNNTGRLGSSIDYTVKSETKVEIGSPVKYAKLMNDGGVVKPVKAKKLAVPASLSIARLTENSGVKEVLRSKEKDGWNISFTVRAILGSMGDVVKTFYYRFDSVTIPERRFLLIDGNDKMVINDVYGKWAGALK